LISLGIQILFEVLFFLLLFFNVFVFRTPNFTWAICVVVGFLILLLLLIKYKKPGKMRDKTPYYIVIGGCLIVQILFYLCGLFTGYQVSYQVFYKNYVSKFSIFAVFFLILLTEFIRYLLLLNLNHYKKNFKYYFAKILMILSYIILDYFLIGDIYDLQNNYELLNFLMIFLIPTTTKHLLLDYTCYKYGFTLNYFYRIIMDLYGYFIPIVPELNVFIQNVILTVLPYFIYVILKNVLENSRKKINLKNKKNVSVLLLLLLTLLVYLVSCQFTYSMIAVGSGSMQGTIDKGDAIIYKKYEKENLSVGDIIVFQQQNRIVIHRIASILETDTDDQAFITKGDANESEDNWIVTKENIIGVVKLRVMLIAWPSVLLNEWL